MTETCCKSIDIVFKPGEVIKFEDIHLDLPFEYAKVRYKFEITLGVRHFCEIGLYAFEQYNSGGEFIPVEGRGSADIYRRYKFILHSRKINIPSQAEPASVANFFIDNVKKQCVQGCYTVNKGDGLEKYNLKVDIQFNAVLTIKNRTGDRTSSYGNEFSYTIYLNAEEKDSDAAVVLEDIQVTGLDVLEKSRA